MWVFVCSFVWLFVFVWMCFGLRAGSARRLLHGRNILFPMLWQAFVRSGNTNFFVYDTLFKLSGLGPRLRLTLHRCLIAQYATSSPPVPSRRTNMRVEQEIIHVPLLNAAICHVHSNEHTHQNKRAPSETTPNRQKLQTAQINPRKRCQPANPKP